MMRKLALGLLAIAAAMTAVLSAAGAKTYPWCVVIQDQDDGWACGFDTFEQCRIEARSGNTGFCAPNPAYRAPEARSRPQKRRRAR
jgi:ABC-type sugar transport system substrate-binding protein